MKNSSYFRLARELEHHHDIFYQLWSFGEPIWDERIETACVVYDSAGRLLSYHFNPNFFDSLNDYERSFVIAHESLHVLHNHGVRIQNMPNKQAANIALDIVVNEALVHYYGFERDKLSFSNDSIFLDNVFPNEGYDWQESAEFFYQKIMEKAIESKNFARIDEALGEGGYQPANVDEITKDFKEFEPCKEQADSIQAGNEAGSTGIKVKPFVKIKKKWETIIKKWGLRNLYRTEYKEQFVQRNRRVHNFPKQFLIPSSMEVDVKIKDMIEVFFYLDTSGSCTHLSQRFFNAAASLPPNRFKIRLFCFDTKVYETDLKSGKLYGFGGTAFDILESDIQTRIQKEGIKYPKAVFVITDGYGNSVQPQFPEKWYWFLSENARDCIPPECNIYDLRDFE